MVRNPVPDVMDDVDAHPCEGTRRTMLADGTSAVIACNLLVDQRQAFVAAVPMDRSSMGAGQAIAAGSYYQ